MQDIKNIETMHGFALVRMVAPGETPGGIVVPDSSDTPTLVLEKAATHYFIGGQEKPFNAMPGARIVLQPGSKISIKDKLLPPGFGVVRILDISAFEVMSAGEA